MGGTLQKWYKLVMSKDFKLLIFLHRLKRCYMYVYTEFSQRVRKKKEKEQINFSRKTNTGKKSVKYFKQAIIYL